MHSDTSTEGKTQMVATVEDFEKLEIRVGRVISAEPFPEARKPAYKLVIDFGELGVRRSSAQLTDHYSAETLVDRQVVAVVNFPRRRVAGIVSEVLVLGAYRSDGTVILLQPEREAELGARIG